MKPDKTTKFLLAAIAVSLFLNALANFIPATKASVFPLGGEFNPVYIKCVSSCSDSIVL